MLISLSIGSVKEIRLPDYFSQFRCSVGLVRMDIFSKFCDLIEKKRGTLPLSGYFLSIGLVLPSNRFVSFPSIHGTYIRGVSDAYEQSKRVSLIKVSLLITYFCDNR